MRLSEEDVRHIADLARLDLADGEVADFRDQLSSVIGFVEKLGEADTEGIEPMSHTVELHNMFRDDAAIACDGAVRDDIVEAFPEKDDDLLKVKAVFS